jgi:hypothetical protein
MAQVVLLKQSTSGLIKKGRVGFSWTTLIFGALVPLVRGDLKWFIIMLLLALLIGLPTLGIGAFIVGVIFAFVYNRKHIESLLEKGYVPSDEHTANQIRAAGITIDGPVATASAGSVSPPEAEPQPPAASPGV